MASNPVFYLLAISIVISSITIQANDAEYGFEKAINKKTFGMRKEKLIHFRLYWHDVVSGPHPTSIPILRPPLNSSTFFGSVNMIDNPLTVGPELSSRIVGRAQGFYAFSSQEEFALLEVMNFAIREGKYNGSTITVLGRNPTSNKVREMPVIGGSGLFRFARGYAEGTSLYSDPKTGDATVEYNVYVLHY